MHGPDGAGSDDLRRRLYRPGATDGDVQRYLAERIPEAPDEVDGIPDGGPRPRRRRLLAVAIPVVAIGAVVVVAPVGPRAPAPPRPATAVGGSYPVDIGDGQLLTVGAVEPRGPTRVATTIGGTAVAGQRFSGSGNGVVTVEPPPGTSEGGRAMIALSSSGSSTVRWRALLLISRADWSTYPVVLARGTADRPSAPVPATTFVYPGRPPTRIAVGAPPGVRWRLVVAVTPGLEPDLR